MKATLLAVCGLSPQVLTESVFALAQQGRLPARVRVITTRPGRDAIIGQLFDGGRGAWHQMLQDLGISAEAIDFSPDAVYVVETAAGRCVEDISTETENEAFLRACLKLAWQYSRDPDGSVFYSIAGGRKTMGAALAFAVQAYGRPQDRVFHVLVSPEFESSRNFFYPPAEPVEITLRGADGEPFRKSTRYAKVSLVSLPFFSFRDRLGGDLLRQPHDPATLLSSLVREESPRLTIDLLEKKLAWKGRELDMRPVHLALYVLFAEVKKSADCAADCPGCDQCWLPQHQLLGMQKELSRIYRELEPRRCPEEMSDSGIYNLTPDNFQSYRSKLNRAIENGFGVIDAPLLQIGSRGRRPGKCYGLPLRREAIRVVR